jgi:hypothetical protein
VKIGDPTHESNQSGVSLEFVSKFKTDGLIDQISCSFVGDVYGDEEKLSREQMLDVVGKEFIRIN